MIRCSISALLVIVLAVSHKLSAQVKADSMQRNIYEVVEQMPEFPGGIIQMELFVVKNLRLPSLKDSPAIGGIYTRFVINENGSVSDIKIARSCGNKQVDDSVKAVISRMPFWKPGTMDGKPVNCYYNLPISCIKYK